MNDGARIQIVGVCEDGKYENLTEDQEPAIFIPILQSPAITSTLVVRASLRAGNNTGSDSTDSADFLAAAMRNALRQLDPGMPVVIQARTAPMAVTLLGPRMATVALGVPGAMGVMISITGIFGMAAYSVSKRLKELGIRLALGAQRRQVLQAALGRAVRLLMIGSFAGLILGLLATRI